MTSTSSVPLPDAPILDVPDSARSLLRLVSLSFLSLTRNQIHTLWEVFCQRSDLPVSDATPLIEHLLEKNELTLNQGRLSCCPALTEIILRNPEDEAQIQIALETVRQVFKIADYRFGYFVRQFNEGVRDLRLALYARRFEDFSKLAQTLQSYFASEWRLRNPYLTLFDDPFSARQFDSLPHEIALTIAATILALRTSRLEPCKGPLSWLREQARLAPEEQRQWFASVLCEPMILRGHLEESLALVRGRTFPLAQAIEGLVLVWRGQMESALPLFEKVLKECRKPQDLRKHGMSGLGGIAYVISLIANGDPKALERASQHIALVIRNGTGMSSIYACLGQVAHATQSVQANPAEDRTEIGDKESLAQLFRALACWWVDGDGERIDSMRLIELARRAESHGYRWIAAEAWELLERMQPGGPVHHATHLHQEMGSLTLVPAIRRQPLWERALGALERLGEELGETATPVRQQRFYWALSRPSNGRTFLIEAREQKRQTHGSWSASKAITFQRLINATQELEGLTDQDKTVIAYLRNALVDQKPHDKRFFAPQALRLLMGHPLVFWGHDLQRPVELVAGRFVLTSGHDRHHWYLQLEPQIPVGEDLWIEQESSHRLRLYALTDEEIRLRDILGELGQQIPVNQEERVVSLLKTLTTRFLVQGDLPTPANLFLSDASLLSLYALLSPHPQGIHLALVVYPLGESGASFIPGAGHAFCIEGESDSALKGVRRALDEERRRAQEIFDACLPWLAPADLPFTGISRHPAAACEILTLLKAMGESAVHLRWPAGESLRIRGEAHLPQMALQIHTRGDWLKISGGVRVDAHTVLELKTLMAAAKHSDCRFVALSDGQFIALSEGLLDRIRGLASLSHEEDAGELQIHALAAPHLSQLIEQESAAITDQRWIELLSRHESLSQWEPQTPPTLQAELRDYQRTGFVWMVRHAEAGAGACLADDMGLGKTLQTLALLLYRAPLGAALVVAPTSVCGNWVQEAKRFSPTLDLHWLCVGGKNQLSDLGPNSLVILSYTLFQQEMEMISSHHWATCVLDEAQAIKNPGTKRSQAAMKIRADFRLLTTGTPIENHLGELWNLFRFINPGLLGTLDTFTEKFSHPIERHGDAEAREQLRRLIQPFILRRTKSQVLTELPQRTEVTLQLEATPEEQAMYEAVRLEALENTTLPGDEQPNRIKVLAGIMRLRRACCHGALILPDRPWISTKITALMEILEELKESGHRALVFSQFVDYLTLIRQALEEHHITYQYLDGSTPSAERSKRVKSFQDGTDDIFLISLKAGGVGLNLTAADYVIHMDPWWNPAVEDQASDFAHRMGQTRPVTVYRLIIKDSIEEKIVALHERKRNLADSLLEGAGETSTLSTEELIGLLQDQPCKGL